MKRFTGIILYGLIAASGLIWAIGCSSDVSGPSNSGFGYTVDVSVDPPALQSSPNSQGYITCIARNPQGNRFRNGWLHFSTKTGYPQSRISNAKVKTDTTANGMDVEELRYYPVSVEGDSDVIYVTLNDSTDEIFLAKDSVTVIILHEQVPPHGPYDIWMQNDAFDPDTLTITHGHTITWTNKDNHNHSVISGVPGMPNGLFNSTDIVPDGTWQHLFDTAGTYNYFCGYHSAMRGVVIVQ